MYTDNLQNTSLYSVFKVSLPMMIAALSEHFMIIVDQLILANYSVTAMTGSSSASLWGAIITCFVMSSTLIVGTFVGQYNGAKKYRMAGIPVWQAIYFSLSVFLLSIPMGLFLGKYCLPSNLQADGIPYFRFIVSCPPILGINCALSAFFVSIGRGFLTTLSIAIANICNLVLGIIFVFGYSGISSLEGTAGAGLGTVLALCTNSCILLYFFLKKDIREKYGTTNFKIRPKVMKKFLRLGIPGGIGHTIEMSAWSFIYYLLATVGGPNIAMIQTMATSTNIFLVFIAGGLEKGLMAITANLLGAKKKEKIKNLLKNGLKIQLSFAGILFFIFYFFPELITSIFIKFDTPPEIMEKAIFILKLLWIFNLLDGILWIVAGIIEGGGDLKFITWTIATTLWIIVALPTIVLYYFDLLTIEKLWNLLIIESATALTVLYLRYKSEKWIKLKIN